MKSLMVVAMAIVSLASVSAMADGFVCSSEAEGLTVKVYNRTHAEEGTRNAAVMVISDQTIAHGNKTIARFQADNQLLASEGARYSANVDLRFNDSGRKGELIAGTKLGQIDQIILSVAFTYGDNLEAGDVVPGTLKIEKRNGDVIRVSMDCERYLKN